MNTPKEALIFTAVGAAALGWAGWTFLEASRARRWPKKTAKVVSSTVLRTSDQDGEKGGTFRVHVTCEYSIAGQVYQCDRVSLHEGSHRSAASAERQKKRYSKGASIQIHCDPGNPARAVVDTSVPSFYTYGAVLGALFLAGGLIVLARQN